MKVKDKICIVGPCLSMGGMQLASVSMANVFNDLGIEVAYVAMLKKEKFFELNSSIRFIEPYGFNISSVSWFKTLFWIRKQVVLVNPEIIIVFYKFYAAIVSLALFGKKYKIIVAERTSPVNRWPLKMRIVNRIAFLLNPPNGAIAQTALAASYQKKYYGSKCKIATIHNMLREIKLHSNIRRKKIVLAVGRLDEATKGFDRLIEAFSMIQVPDWQLVFAGGGDQGNSLREQAEKLGIASRVLFLGKVKNIDEVYATASIFVIPSRSEGFPNALCEAMAAGLACISFDFISGPRDIITNGQDGFLIENGNIPDLAAKIHELILRPNERQRIGYNAMKIRDRLSKEKITKAYIDFLIEV